MEINDILSKLGLDFSNAEAKRGAMEAIDAIMASRIDLGGVSGNLPGKPVGPIEVEIDPDLLQPSVKHKPNGGSDDDIEVDDEEKILDQVKHNKSEEPEWPEDPDEPGDDQGDAPGEPIEPGNEPSEPAEPVDEPGSPGDQGKPTEPGEPGDDPSEPTEPGEIEEPEDEEEPDNEEAPEDEGDGWPEEEDLLDDDTKQATSTGDAEKKAESRRRKRERVLRAAQASLAKAQANGASKALISELENAIAALEALVEAATKNLADLSDEEFNSMINRVFDAIDALNPGELTYSSDEQRQAKAKEIKADLSNSKTQAELSAEDVAAIRAEHQAIKARDDEVAKYRQRSRSSFQGFQEFMNSLQRGIALQVSNNKERNNTWSALSRRNSGAGVLRQGQRIDKLPTKKIPIIDFYFDQSGSWDEDDLVTGNQAVEALAKMQEDEKIKINIYYFDDSVWEKAEDARNENGTTYAWNNIIKNIVATDATNVVIMTDSDMENRWDGQKALKHTVSGFVWYLWRNGSNAPRLPRDLQGRGGTMQYSC